MAIPSHAIGATTAPPVTSFTDLPPFSTMTPTETWGNAALVEAWKRMLGLPIPSQDRGNQAFAVNLSVRLRSSETS